MAEYLSTEELAQDLKVKSATVRRGLCVDGHYLGLKPIKLANGRLLWSNEAKKRLLDKEAA